MVAATLNATVRKRFFSGEFAPPVGYSPSIAPGSEVTAEEILSRGVDPSDWSFPAVLSTERIDRQDDCIVPEGCDYADFARNCVVFFDHQTLPFPIGTMRSPHDGRLYLAIVPGKGIIGRIWLNRPEDGDKSERAEDMRFIWWLVANGRLNGLSVGFDPKGPVRTRRGGGSLYSEWFMLELSLVALPANPDCLIIREPTRIPSAIFKRLNPAILKSLSVRNPNGETMTLASIAKGEHHNTRDIKYRNGEWIILDNKTRKVLSHHKSRSEALAAMRALQYGKHKSMSESSGPDGGYVVPEGHKAMCKSIAERLDDHDAKAHAAYFSHKTGELRHVHPEDATEEHVKGIAADLHDIPGVKSLTQTSEHPKEDEEFERIYPHGEQRHRAGVEKSKRRLSAVGKALYRIVKKRRLKAWGIERLVARYVPALLKCETPEKRAVSIAWGLACVKKGYMPLVVRDAADGDSYPGEDDDTDDAEDATDDAAADAALDADEESGEGPAGLELAQTAIENIEAALPRMEPERREFWENIVDQIRDHGQELYPDEDFGGEDDAGEEGAKAGEDNDADQQDETDEMLARYKSYRPVRVKRISVVKKLKAMRRDPKVEDALRKSANHLHAIGDMAAKFDDKGAHLEGYTASHHKHCRIRARELDRLRGTVTKGDMEPDAVMPSTDANDDDFGDVGSIMKGLRSDFDKLKEGASSLHQVATGKRLY